MNNINSNIFGNNLNGLNINNIQTNFNGLDSKYKIIIFAVFIVFLVLLGFIGYIYWTNYKTNKVQSFQEETLLDGMYDCNNRKSPMVIDASKIPASTMGSEYSLNIWIYVAEAQNRDGYVLKRGPAAGKIISDCFPGIILKKDTNDMVIYFKKETSNAVDTVSTFTGDYTIEQFHSDKGRLVEGLENLENFYGENENLENNYIVEGFTVNAGPGSSPAPEVGETEVGETEDEEMSDTSCVQEDNSENYITIHNIPLQRWTCLNISVFNQTVDIYIDGKLKGTENFRFSLKPPGPLPMTLGPVHEDGNDGSGFNGYLSRIKYSNRALNPGQVRQRYEEGPRITKGLWESFKSFFSSEEENVEE